MKLKRTLIKETPGLISQKVRLCGSIQVTRDHGKVIFFDLADRSGMIQAVVVANNKDNFEIAKKCRSQYVVELIGLIKERPGKQKNNEKVTGSVEMEVEQLKIISAVEGDLPFDVSVKELDLNLETLLDNRNLALRNEKIKSIFKLYSQLLTSYQQVMTANDFVEIKTPKILSAATEGGANFFKVKYFKREAVLAQSPQFYKQMGVGIFERVFEIGPVFRAEPHYTSRHVNEYISFDAEMGYIEGYEDLMDQLEKVFWKMMKDIKEKCSDILNLYNATVPNEVKIPRIKLAEALKILEEKCGKHYDEMDIDPEGERLICDYAKEQFGSDLIFLTHYPTGIRPMYTMPCENNPEESCSFDLIFRGVEILTGGQRIHNYNQLVESIRKRGMNPEEFKDYLEIFRYGMPAHGGWAFGSERIVQKILGLKSIKEAVLYPRDVNRLTP